MSYLSILGILRSLLLSQLCQKTFTYTKRSYINAISTADNETEKAKRRSVQATLGIPARLFKHQIHCDNMSDLQSRFSKPLSQFQVTNTNQSTIIKLKKYQIAYEQRVSKLIQDCDQQSQIRNSNYKELEELSKHLSKLSNRWKRMNSLIVESLLELDLETIIAQDEFNKIDKKENNLQKLIEKNQEEVASMSNLITLLRQVCAKSDS